uniref:Putative lipocalin n=1 Tax=Ixodes ricinus TaxID=34613 RepID=V5GEJ3_IXORI
MLALKHLVFCLSVSAAYANVEFQSWKKPPDNNPDLNRKRPWRDAGCSGRQSRLRRTRAIISFIVAGWVPESINKNVEMPTK